MDKKQMDKDMEVTVAPDMDEIKKTMTVILQNFTSEEAGNKVTSNNMAGLSMNLIMALDGKISTKKE